jgi:hypothetical protein
MDVDQGLKWAGETLGLHRCGPLKWPVPRKVLGGKCMKRAAAMKLSLAELVEFNCRHLTNEYLKKLANEFYDHYKEFVKKDQVKHQRAKAHCIPMSHKRHEKQQSHTKHMNSQV